MQEVHQPFLARILFWMFTPNYRVTVVNELTPYELGKIGIRSVILDVDCTLKRYDSETLEPWVLSWLDSLRDSNISICLLSNGKPARIQRFAQRYNIPFIALALKPAPWGCLRVIRTQGWEKKSTLMVGDQLFADVMAGRLAGIKTALVTPIHPELEPIFTRIKRPLEKILLRTIRTT